MVNAVGPRGPRMDVYATGKENVPSLVPIKEEMEEGEVVEEKVKEKKTRAPNPWLIHVAAFKKAHPDLKYKEVLKQAKETYVKVIKAVPS